MREVDLKVPLVVRLEGTNVEKGKEVFLLNKISGYFKPSQMSALVGVGIAGMGID